MESWVILEGLRFAWRKGIYCLEVQSDAKKVVIWINNEMALNGPASGVIQECKSMMEKDWEVTIKHVYCEQNRVANKLAKMGTHLRTGWRQLENPQGRWSRVFMKINVVLLGQGVSRRGTIIISDLVYPLLTK